jgi:hypothetical protein
VRCFERERGFKRHGGFSSDGHARIHTEIDAQLGCASANAQLGCASANANSAYFALGV